MLKTTKTAAHATVRWIKHPRLHCGVVMFGVTLHLAHAAICSLDVTHLVDAIAVGGTAFNAFTHITEPPHKHH